LEEREEGEGERGGERAEGGRTGRLKGEERGGRVVRADDKNGETERRAEGGQSDR
jgi:hypothetical protein